MKFGKVAHPDQINFTLPQDALGNDALFSKLPTPNQAPQVFVGCTGWSMKEWVGTVYPKGTKTKDYLKYYSKQFNTIELNTTHYRIPNTATIEKWYAESTSDFRFCPKIPQSISHSNTFAYGTGYLVQFCESILGLKEKLGCSFMQLPPYFSSERIGLLEKFLKNFPKEVPLAVEIRHQDWFNSPLAFQNFAKLLEEHQVTAVITDVAGRRDVLHMRLTTSSVMIRFVGNGLIPSDYTRIDEWVQRLKNWFDQGLQTVYFFTHEPDNILAPQLAQYLCEQLAIHCKVALRGPKFYNTEDQQMSLF